MASFVALEAPAQAAPAAKPFSAPKQGPRTGVHPAHLLRAMGYWVVDQAGGVGAAGGAPALGGLSRHVELGTPIVSMAATPNGKGYWMVSAAGTVFAFGDAPHLGYAPPSELRSAGRSLASIVATPEGGGYWVLASNGRVLCFGDAVCYQRQVGPMPKVVGLAPTPDGQGYWLATSTGAVLAYGDAKVDGSATAGGAQVVGIAAPRSGQGYWVADEQGSTFGFGAAAATKAKDLASKAVAIVPDPSTVAPGPDVPAAPGAKVATDDVQTPGDVAVRFALAQVGKPYAYGAAGPYAYDCSGLAMAAWATAGVYMPHRAAEQFYAGPHVPLSQLQPGDLVFWASDPSDPATIYHVALYIGGGETVQATHTGSTVMVMPMWSQDLVGVGTQP